MDQNLYEWVGEGANLKYAINAQDCVHCKTPRHQGEAGNYTSVSNCMLVSISVGDPWGPVGGAEP